MQWSRWGGGVQYRMSRDSVGSFRQTDPAAGAAFFDVDGTLVSTHIVHQYVRVRRFLRYQCGGRWPTVSHRLWLTAFYVRCLQYLVLDHVSRTRMNTVFYRNYAGLSCDQVRVAAGDCFECVLQPHLFEDAVNCVVGHLKASRRVVFVTGSIDFLVAPLAKYLESLAGDVGRIDVVARSLVTNDGRFTGELSGPPIGEEEKAAEVKRYVSREGIDLEQSYAYGDSVADAPMLELVGTAVAVNADRALRARARAKSWSCVEWRAMRNGS